MVIHIYFRLVIWFYGFMYIRFYAGQYIRIYIFLYICMCVYTYVCIYIFMVLCNAAFTQGNMYGMYLCISLYMYIWVRVAYHKNFILSSETQQKFGRRKWKRFQNVNVFKLLTFCKKFGIINCKFLEQSKTKNENGAKIFIIKILDFLLKICYNIRALRLRAKLKWKKFQKFSLSKVLTLKRNYVIIIT